VLGRRLAETLSLDPDIEVVAVWRSPHRAAVETEEILRSEIGQEGLSLPPASDCGLLDPRQFRPYATRTRADRNQVRAEVEISERLEETLVNKRNGSTVLIVGHQPMLSWLGETLLSGRRAGPFRRGLPLAREVALLGIDRQRRRPSRGSRRLEWSIEYTDKTTEDVLRAKIEAKIDIAKFLAGVLIFGLGVVLGALLDPKKLDALHVARPHSDVLLPLAGASFFLAIGMFLATLYAYDRLLMPSRFWSESPPTRRSRPHWLVCRPPSSRTYVLYQNMIRIWQRLFLPATLFVMAGIGLLGYVALGLSWWQGLIAVAIALLASGWYFSSRPRLGTED
jgi:broad specificity phosphatase PhoE